MTIFHIPKVCSISAQVCPRHLRRESAGLPWTIHTAGCPSSALTAALRSISPISTFGYRVTSHIICVDILLSTPLIWGHIGRKLTDLNIYTIYSIQPKLPIEVHMFQCCLDNNESMTNMMECINVECLDLEHKLFCPTPAGLGRGGSWIIFVVSSASSS